MSEVVVEGNIAMKSKKKKRSKNKDIDPAVLATRRQIQFCAKNQNLRRAIQLYDEALTRGIFIESPTYHCLLSLCSMVNNNTNGKRIHVGTPRTERESDVIAGNNDLKQSIAIGDSSTFEKSVCNSCIFSNKKIITEAESEVSLSERKEHAYRIKQHMDENGIDLNENGYTVLIRLLCSYCDENVGHNSSGSNIKGDQHPDLVIALDLLERAEHLSGINVKLRLFAPILKSLSLRNCLDSILKIWERISMKDLDLSEYEYLQILQCAVNVGDALVVDRVLANIAEDILIPSKLTTSILIDWFSSSSSVLSNSTEMESLWPTVSISKSNNAPSLGPMTSYNGWEISQNCLIDSKTGKLLNGCMTGSSLKPVSLSKNEWDELIAMNDAIVKQGSLDEHKSEFQGGRKGKKRKIDDASKRHSDWNLFNQWLSDRSKDINVVIDGANVGYFETNYPGAPKHVDYDQIDWIVRYFQNIGMQPIVFLHERHFSPKLMPSFAEETVKRWIDFGLVYKTPFDSNDDWYWLHAALYYGIDTMVLTNDECRDHHFQMLAHRSFVKWQERHQIRFKFGSWTYTKGYGKHRSVELQYPPFYSRRIQSLEDGLVIPQVRKGDKGRFLDGEYVAESEPEHEQYTCIRRK